MTAVPVQLCVSVTQAGTSVLPGHAATFNVSVWTQNGAAPGVTVSVRAGPASAAADFSGRCPGGNGTATCRAGDLGNGATSGSDQLQVQVSVPAKSVAAVTVTATVSTNPAMTSALVATDTAAVTVPRATPSGTSSRPSRAAGSVPAIAPMPGGQLTLPAGTVTVHSPGSVNGLLPSITATPTPSPAADPTTAGNGARATLAADTILGMNPAGFYLALIGALTVLFLGGARLVRRRPG
jgi:hypothetical protein